MTGTCFLCGNYETVEKHHIFGGAALRPKADKLGLTVMLCPWCHQYDADSAHRSAETRRLLRKMAQRKAMETLGWSAGDFAREFGKNYLDEDELTEDGYLIEREDGTDNAGAFCLTEEAALPW